MNNHGNRHVMNRKHDGSKTPKLTKAEKKLARKIAQAGRIAARAPKKGNTLYAGQSNICIWSAGKGLPERPRRGLGSKGKLRHGSTWQR